MHLLLCLLYFNPRSHERSDGNCYTLTSNSGISIHAPTRGATMVAILNQKIPVFQSTLPREERLFGFGIRVIISIFQSTLPREERRYPHGLQSLLFHNFNPRSHERSDIPAGSFHCCLHYISIHAPTRGATFWIKHKGYNFYISIHAPTRGATIVRGEALMTYSISIHAPTRGATAILHKKFVYFYTIPTINI